MAPGHDPSRPGAGGHTAGVESTLVYDGDCGICQASVGLLARAGCRAVAVPSHQWLCTHPDLAERAAASVLLIDADGTVLEAEHAVAGALGSCRRPVPWLGALIELPGVRLVARRIYRLVAPHRPRISRALGLTACTIGDRPS
jgi:predicted DCC family thiol-disulfide oxidoreductase YuxK